MTILSRFQEFLRLNGGHPECEKFAEFVDAESQGLADQLADNGNLLKLAGEAEAFQRYFWLHIATDAREREYTQFCLDKWGDDMPLLLTIQLPQKLSFNKHRSDQIKRLIRLAQNKNHGSTVYCCLPYAVQSCTLCSDLTMDQMQESCAEMQRMLELCAAYGGNAYIALTSRNGETVYGFAMCAAGVFSYNPLQVQREFLRNVGGMREKITYKRCGV